MHEHEGRPARRSRSSDSAVRRARDSSARFSTTGTSANRSAQDIIGEVQPQFFSACPGVFAFAINPPAFGGFRAAGAVRRAEPRLRGAGARNGRARQRARSTIPGLLNVDTDLRVTKPGAGRDARSRSRRRSRRAGARHRDDAADAARRARREPLHVRQQAVRRHPAARSRRARDAVRHQRASGARTERRRSCRSMP